MSPSIPIVVLGAGPAGLGAAYQLARRGFDVTVVERGAQVGGNAGSFDIDGLRVDYGSHRLHPACSPEVFADIRALLRDDLLERPRHGRIRLSGRWVHFPLTPLDLVRSLPLSFALGVLGDSVPRRARTNDVNATFASVLERGLGRTICREFYFPYARKIWGVDPTELDADQARKRVSAGSMRGMLRKVLNAVPGLKAPGAGRFFYPRQGYGQISEAYSVAAQNAGATVKLATTVTGLHIDSGRAVGITLSNGSSGMLPVRQLFSTVPLPLLCRMATPSAPSDVVTAATQLRYRGMILVYLVLRSRRFTEFDAHYFPGSDIPITRLSEPKNYGLAVHDEMTVLCAELPCGIDEPVWSMSDEQLGDLVKDALATAGVPVKVPVVRVLTRKLAQAYPIYTRGYRDAFDRLDTWAASIEGLLTFGRQGLFAHDNTHHALAMAYAAARCLSDDGVLDRERWAERRREFESHVVED